MEGAGDLVPMAVYLVDRLAIVLEARRFRGMDNAGYRSFRSSD
jgi:hypothetical protein